MCKDTNKLIEWFLRLSISLSFLSAVADRFGIWSYFINNSAWGNWGNFVTYTQSLLPFVPSALSGIVAGIATLLEVVLAILLFTKFNTHIVAKASGFLLLSFAVAMSFAAIKAPFDYSVFTASAAAFALSIIADKRITK